MSNQSPKGLIQALNHEGKLLEGVFKKLAELKALKSILDTHLDQKLASRCSIANFEDGHLSIITESAIWATQFRFQIANIQKNLLKHPEFKDLKHITCKVRPALAKEPPKKATRPVTLLTKQTAKMVEEAANTITHEKLREIMRKIARERLDPKIS